MQASVSEPVTTYTFPTPALHPGPTSIYPEILATWSPLSVYPWSSISTGDAGTYIIYTFEYLSTPFASTIGDDIATGSVVVGDQYVTSIGSTATIVVEQTMGPFVSWRYIDDANPLHFEVIQTKETILPTITNTKTVAFETVTVTGGTSTVTDNGSDASSPLAETKSTGAAMSSGGSAETSSSASVTIQTESNSVLVTAAGLATIMTSYTAAESQSPTLYTPARHSSPDVRAHSMLPVEIAVPIGGLFALAMVGAVIWYLRRRRLKRVSFGSSGSPYNARPFGMKGLPKTWSQTSFTTQTTGEVRTPGLQEREHQLPEIPEIAETPDGSSTRVGSPFAPYELPAATSEHSLPRGLSRRDGHVRAAST